ncbi:MAG: LicD family protein [Eubacterium sp.]|nr:LicD family protein [Eubacterium sp.]
MNEVQSNLYEMLIELDDICRKNDIIYYLAGGTALGAVRNQGFLPWDDDIDLYITRENWLKLEKVLENTNLESRSIVTMNNTDYYCNPIPRYVNCNTTLIYRSQMLCGKAAGQHIEMLIMDPMPIDEKEKDNFKRHLLVYTELITPYFVVNRGVINPDSYFDYKLYNHYYKMSKKIGLKATLKKLENILFQYSEEDCEVFCMRWGLRILMYDKRMFGTPRLQLFEDREFYVAEHAEEIFRIAYGDTWMYIPEANEQVTHNSFMDLTTPFEVYVNDYMQRLDRPSIFKAYKKNKRRLMKTLIKREQYVKSRLELKRLFLEDELNILWDDNTEKIETAVKNRDWKAIDLFYNSIDSFLFSPSSKKYYEIIRVDEERIYPYFLSLLLKGLYSKVIALSTRYQLNGIEFKDPKMLKLIELARRFKNVSQCIYDYDDIQGAGEELAEISDEFKNNILYKRNLYTIKLEQAKDSSDKLNQLKAELEKEIESTNDGELFKLLGDCHYYCGETEQANEAYAAAHNNTRNGMMLLDIYKKTGNKEFMMVE